ncbi:MAG: ribosomal RNA small subunit methyltransferase B [Melioribacteraceae bacterium]|nr:MAG: ribosomal RNA small subunit methyltransferase B [Melioribacteraceae bacterium]
MTNSSNGAFAQTDEFGRLNLYTGVRGLAVKVLNRIDRTDAYLDKMLEIEIRNSELSGVDKALLFEIVHGVIRWLGRIDWVLTGFYRGQFSKCIPNVKNAMRVALYQILFLDKVPDYAAVNEAVSFVKKLQGEKPAGLTNAVLRNIIRSKNGIRYPDPEEDLSGYLSAYYSHPSWMVKRWLNLFGREFTESLLIANNNKPHLGIRMNSLKTNLTEFMELMDKVDLSYSRGKFIEEFIKLMKLSNITDWEYFQKGYFTIQDESTGLSCKALDVKPGMRVLDLCSAPGGKTGYIADLMQNEGEIVAIDRYESRLKLLEQNLERLGIKNVRTVAIDAREFDEQDFDRVLVDVPCSGLGTLTKKPDIKWKRDWGDIRKLNEIQLDLLTTGARFVKKDGILIYSTCTIEPDENYEIVKKFLYSNANFELVKLNDSMDSSLIDKNGCVQSYPNVHKIDGAFVAKLRKKS